MNVVEADMNRFWKFMVDWGEKVYEARRESLLKTYGLQDVEADNNLATQKDKKSLKTVKQLEMAESRS